MTTTGPRPLPLVRGLERSLVDAHRHIDCPHEWSGRCLIWWGPTL